MSTDKIPNHLIHESSPYLLQHAYNPVDWYPWNEEALLKAKKEDKLILVSIGYAACHWCHVMERECFEVPEVATVMNHSFINIKVDREERPDVDQVYMDAVMLMTRQGGWPLNVVCLPDGRPVFGGTYFPKERWVKILEELAKMFINERPKLEEYATRLMEGLVAMDEIVSAPESEFRKSDLDSMLAPWKNQLDYIEGGNDRAPKFPMPNNFLFLQNAAWLSHDKELLDQVDLTLHKIAAGGIYDHVGGGFARYSTDAYWKVPHFEKMLYDNGQLISLYSQAWLRTKASVYQQVVEQSIDWVFREMTSPDGGFYSSLDADSEGEEGKYYVWQKSEIENILDKDAEWFCKYFQVSDSGNWEHTNIIFTRTTQKEFAPTQGWSETEFFQKIVTARNLLLKEREKRIEPGLDDKILASWNGLMLKALVDASISFGRSDWMDAAVKNAQFIEKNLLDGKRLNRNFKNGKASVNAFLDDYALTAAAFIRLYQGTADFHWLERAKSLAEYAIEHFYDEKRKMFFYTHKDDPALIARKTEIHDNVIPASASIMANVLLDLSRIYERSDFEEISVGMLASIKKGMLDYPSAHSNWGILMLRQIYPDYEVVIAGPEAIEYAKEWGKIFYPQYLQVVSISENSQSYPILESRWSPEITRIFVCQNKVCKLPVSIVSEAMKFMTYE